MGVAGRIISVCTMAPVTGNTESGTSIGGVLDMATSGRRNCAGRVVTGNAGCLTGTNPDRGINTTIGVAVPTAMTVGDTGVIVVGNGGNIGKGAWCPDKRRIQVVKKDAANLRAVLFARLADQRDPVALLIAAGRANRPQFRLQGRTHVRDVRPRDRRHLPLVRAPARAEAGASRVAVSAESMPPERPITAARNPHFRT